MYETKRNINRNVQLNKNEMKDAAFIIDKPCMKTCIKDSGASSYIANDREKYINFNDTDEATAAIANVNALHSYESGEIIIMRKTSNGDINRITLN